MDYLYIIIPIICIMIILLGIMGHIIIKFQQRCGLKVQEANDKNNETFAKALIQMNKEFMKEVADIAKNGAIPEVDLLNNTFVKLRNSIKDGCIQALNDSGAARLAVYLFHNGSHSTQGINFFKMSCICEKIALGSGLKEQTVEHSSIPINLFDEMLDKLIDNGRYIIMNEDNIQNTNHKIFISCNKIKYAQAVSIFDKNSNILGFVLVEMDHSYDRELANEEKEKIDVLVNMLAPILSYTEYTEVAMEETKTVNTEIIEQHE